MSSSTRAPASIDDYISAFPPAVQSALQQVRQAVRNAAPDAQEAISYRIPAFRLNGVLVYFAAFKKHVGFYPPVRGTRASNGRSRPMQGRRATCDSRSTNRCLSN